MIRHTMLFKKKPDVTRNQIDDLFTNVVQLADHLTGIVSITGGACHYHQGNHQNSYTHGFSIDFDDEKSRTAFFSDAATKNILETINTLTLEPRQDVSAFDFGVWADN